MVLSIRWTSKSILFISLLIPAILLLICDHFLVTREVWKFTDQFRLGITLWQMPLEHILIVPILSLPLLLFFQKLSLNKNTERLNQIALVINAFVLLFLMITVFKNFNRYFAYLLYWLAAFYMTLLLMNKVKWMLTYYISFLLSLPLVLSVYIILLKLPLLEVNSSMVSGHRLMEVPLEFLLYYFLLSMMSCSLFSFLNKRFEIRENRQSNK